ncbi:MAG: hypothetical protein IPI99_09810 [Saprospiraceae bacterium]|nr:hypothetical protein [Saprospiraceae bacterium]
MKRRTKHSGSRRKSFSTLNGKLTMIPYSVPSSILIATYNMTSAEWNG